ncbi:MAG: DnaJ domain-containing protein [Acidobacteria bacterium]|nr:DnaJ domain-containing protein [Acidobacteriota bacterium]
MSQRITLYDVLGIGPDASDEDIRAAFRKLTLKYHPDRYTSDRRDRAEKRFQEITEAFNVLSRPELRQKYDRDIAGSIPSRSGQDPRELGRRLAARGAQEYKNGKFAEARENLELAVHHDDSNSRGHYFLGMTLMHFPNQQKAALRHLDRAVTLEPDNMAIRGEVARCFLAAGMKLRAQRLAEETLAADPTNSKAAEVMNQLGKSDSSGGEGLLGKLKRKG